MSCLRLGLECRHTLFLNESQVLSAERVPTKTLQVEPEPLGSRANVVAQNRSVVEWLAVPLEHMVLIVGPCWFVQAKRLG